MSFGLLAGYELGFYPWGVGNKVFIGYDLGFLKDMKFKLPDNIPESDSNDVEGKRNDNSNTEDQKNADDQKRKNVFDNGDDE